MNFNKGAGTTQWGKDRVFNKSCWENWISKNEIEPLPYTYIKIQNGLNLNIRPKTVRLSEVNKRENFGTLDLAMISYKKNKNRQQKQK